METQELTPFRSWKIANRNQLKGIYQNFILSGEYNGITFNEYCATCYMPSIPIDFLTEEAVNCLIENIIEIENKIQKLKMSYSLAKTEGVKESYENSIFLARKVVKTYRSLINNILNTY